MPVSNTYRERTYQQLKFYSEARGGRLLSPRYEAVFSLLKLACGQGHEFKKTSKDLQRGAWCPACAKALQARRRVLELELAGIVARERGGTCTAKRYENARLPISWRCAFGHDWRASLDNVRNKRSWCPTCARGRPRLGRRKHKMRVPILV